MSWPHKIVERTNFMFISLFAPNKRTKEKAPSSLAYGSPRETQEHGGVKNSSRFSRDLDSLPSLIRILTLRSATLQRVLKPKIKKTFYFRAFEFVFRVFPSERSRRPRNARMSFLGGTHFLDKQRKGTKNIFSIVIPAKANRCGHKM